MPLSLAPLDTAHLPLDALKLEAFLESLALRTLNSPELACPAQSPLAEVPLAASGALPILEGLSFNLAADASLRIDAFNSADDADSEKVLQAGAQGPLPLPFGGDRCYLRTQIQGHLKSTLAQGLKGAGFDLDGLLLLGDYRFRKGGDRVRDAVEATLSNPRVLFRLEDLESLGEGDALALRALGSLRTTLDLDWSTLLANRWGALSSLLGAGEVATLQITRGFEVNLELSLQDEFQITAARVSADSFALDVRKASRRTLGSGGALGVKAAFTDPEGVERALEALIGQGVLGPLRQELDTLRKAASLTPEQQAALGRILNLLGIQDPRPALDDVSKRLDQLQGQLKAKAAELAQAQAELAFRAEYNALSTEETLLTAILDGALLRKHHADLVRGRLGDLLQDLRNGKGQVLSFLDRQSEERTASWGFTLGLGRWKLGGQDKLGETRSEVRNLQDSVRVSQHTLRSYSSRWIGEDNAWFLDLKADMDAFSTGSAPELGEYAFGLHLLNSRQGRLTADSMDSLLDRAVAWDILPQGGVEAAKSGLQAFLSTHGLEGRPVETIVQARLEDGAFRAFLDTLAQASLGIFAPPLAAAMPRWGECDGGRIVALRRQIFGPLWAYVLATPNPVPRRMAEVAYAQLLKLGERNLANREHRYLEIGGPDWNAFGGIVGIFNDTQDALQAFLQGCQQLQQGIQAGTQDRKGFLQDRFKDMSRPGGESLHIWALGALLADQAQVGGFPVERSLTVRGVDQPEKTFVLAGTHGA